MINIRGAQAIYMPAYFFKIERFRAEQKTANRER